MAMQRTHALDQGATHLAVKPGNASPTRCFKTSDLLRTPRGVPYYRVCGLLRFNADELGEWFKSKRVTPTQSSTSKRKVCGLRPLRNFNVERLRKAWGEAAPESPPNSEDEL